MSCAECVINMQLAAYDVHAWTMFGTLFALFASINKQRLCGCACLVSNNTMFSWSAASCLLRMRIVNRYLSHLSHLPICTDDLFAFGLDFMRSSEIDMA